MANKDATLQQGEEQIYPRTFTRNVYENDGKTPLDTTLAKLQQQINNNVVVVDKELSSTSENPVSNKTITDKFDELQTYFTEQDNNIQENFNTQIQEVYDSINSLSGSIDEEINNLQTNKQDKLNFSDEFSIDENNNVSLNIQTILSNKQNKLYKHSLRISYDGGEFGGNMELISTSNTPITTSNASVEMLKGFQAAPVINISEGSFNQTLWQITEDYLQGVYQVYLSGTMTYRTQIISWTDNDLSIIDSITELN